jgi:integrase
MSEANSTGSAPPRKPAKPYPDYPLTPHPTRRWCKKIRGRLYYFGPIDDPDGALRKYLEQKDDLLAGRTPRETPDALTVFTLCGRFLTTKKAMLDSGELSARTFADYTAACQRVIQAFGRTRLVSDLRPADFERLRVKMAKNWGPVRTKAEIVRARVIFNYAAKSGLIDRPLLLGEGFKVPSKKTLRLHRAASGPKLFEPVEIQAMIAAANPALKAMILLGVNCAFGNTDVGHLPLSALDLDAGWVSFPRKKTGIARRCPLWPETVQAVKAWLAVRPEPRGKADEELLFLTRFGRGWFWADATDNPVSKEMTTLLGRLGIGGRRRAFYALRHVFQTIGDECGDFLAVRSIMGHATDDIADVYRERISDERLRKVTEHVRGWLLAAPAARV